MKISNSMSDSAIANELFERIEQQRKALKLTQDAIARTIGISRKSYSAAIKSGKTSLLNFIAILRHLELLDNLELIVQTPEQSPMAALKATRLSSSRKNTSIENIGKARLAAPNVEEAIEKGERQILVGTGAGGKAQLDNPILASRQRLKVQE